MQNVAKCMKSHDLFIAYSTSFIGELLFSVLDDIRADLLVQMVYHHQKNLAACMTTIKNFQKTSAPVCRHTGTKTCLWRGMMVVHGDLNKRPFNKRPFKRCSWAVAWSSIKTRLAIFYRY